MDKQSAQERIQKLRALIDYHRALYHTYDAPEIDDAAFDTLKNELEELENAYPELATPDSPTQKIGGKPLDVFEKIHHEKPMLSFNDAFSKEEVYEWLERFEKYIGKKVHTHTQSLFYCELKLDGLAIELVYDHGILSHAITRGDGSLGEDVTQNVKTISTIPQKLVQLGGYSIPDHLVVRGEIYVPTAELHRINKEQEKKGQKPYANPRNLAAGSIRQLDSLVVARRNLESYQYDIVVAKGIQTSTHEEKHKVLASWGFHTNPHNRIAKTINDVFAFRDEWDKKRKSLPYEIDGVVVLINDNGLFDAGGAVGKAPRGAIAYKFSPRQATTLVEDVVIQVGRTGVLTPVAVLKPVEVSGVTISHATLHNFDEIKRLGLLIGDTVIITRSGDVIPKIISVISQLRTGKEKRISVPTRCPVDHSPVLREGVLVRCSNPSCGAKNRNALIHFVSRSAFNIKGLGEKVIDRFLDEGLIRDAGDLFYLSEGDIASLERFGEKSAHNLITEIQNAKRPSLSKLIYALGILHVGEELAASLATHYSATTKKKGGVTARELFLFFANRSQEQLEHINDIGSAVSKSVVQWFADPSHKELMEKLSRAGVIATEQKITTKGPLSGHVICITGTLPSLSRQQAKDMIIAAGGRFQADITSETTEVLAGENPGSKYTQAQKKGLPLWDENEFRGILKR